eukprot:m.72527 g.72527  ORF g.72527 m.72527 type:complete len:57 (+) comp7998_c0_seq2:577-747(+)
MYVTLISKEQGGEGGGLSGGGLRVFPHQSVAAEQVCRTITKKQGNSVTTTMECTSL